MRFRRIALVGVMVAGMLVPVASMAAPSNDSFPGKNIWAPFEEGFDLATATSEDGEPAPSCNYNGAYRTIWYSFTATSSDPLVALARGPSDGEISLAVFSGSHIRDLTQLGCTTSSRYYHLAADLSLQPTIGWTYYFQVAYQSASRGTFELFHPTAPANDSFANAAVLTGFPARVDGGRDFGATLEVGEPKPSCGSASVRSTWFKWTAPESSRVVVDRLDGVSYGALAVYHGTDLATLTNLACKSYSSTIALDAVAGETYHFQALDIGGRGGSVMVGVQGQVPGDDMAQMLDAVIGVNTVRMLRATVEVGEPLTCAYGDTVWLKISGLSGVLKLTLPNASPYTVLALYDQNMVRKDCFYSGYSRYLEADPTQTYYIQLSAHTFYSGQTPDTSVTIDRIPSPANDSFSSAQEVVGIPVLATGSNAGAMKGSDEPTPTCAERTGATIWYKWNALAGRPYVVDTVGSAIDTTLAVYTGESSSNLDEIACNDDHNALQSRVVLDATQGTTYYFQIGGFASARGDVKLNIDIEPMNDDLAEAETVSGPLYQDTSVNLRATIEPMEPEPSCNRNNDTVNTLWYRYVPTTAGPVTIDTYGSSFDTVVAVYSGSTYLNLTEVACSEDVGLSTNQWSVATFAAEAGKTYYIQVGSWKSPHSSSTTNGTVVMRVLTGSI